MFTVLYLNQKGGVGKTTLADELAFALERRGKTVAFVTTDPQGGSVHEVCEDPDFAETCDYQIVDTAGSLSDGIGDWCRAADLILVPMLPSTRDMEPTDAHPSTSPRSRAPRPASTSSSTASTPSVASTGSSWSSLTRRACPSSPRCPAQSRSLRRLAREGPSPTTRRSATWSPPLRT